MVGPPGAGKTMLARRFPGILPPLSSARAMETTMIYSIMGLLQHVSRGGLVTHAPFRAPHHTASDAGLIGGTGTPRPGEITLAHNGVLFLDELPEFRRHVLETCLLYTSDAADERSSVDLGGRRIIKKKKN